MIDKVTFYLDQHAGDARALLEQLCRQPSVTAQNYGTTEMAELMEWLLQATGFQTKRLTSEGAPPVIFGTLPGRSPYTILLYNHYDVQPAEPYELWETPPYEPTVRDGKLYARGSSDNKGEIAARLAAIRAWRAVHGELPITLHWMIEGEEEIGSPHFGVIAETYADALRADGCFWEGGSFSVDDRPILTLGTKGLLYVQLDVECLGGDAHSGNASYLPSAAWRLVQALATLKAPDGRVRIPGFYDDALPPSEAQLAALADQPDTDDQLRSTFQVKEFLGGATGYERRVHAAFDPTCNIAGLLSGYTGAGTKTVLPGKAMAKIDFRLVPNQRPQDILAKLQAHLHAGGYDDIKITIFASAEPLVTPVEHPLVQRMIAIAAGFDGKRPVINPIMGGTLPFLGDLRRFVGVPGLAVPGNATYWANGAHAPNEHIRLSDLDRAVRFNCYMFEELAKGGV